MLSYFPLDVLDEIWDVIESVSEGFLTYSSMTKLYIVHTFYMKSLLFRESSPLNSLFLRVCIKHCGPSEY